MSQTVTEMTEQLIEQLKKDIEKCTTREEHIRTSARANEAQLILQRLRLDEPADGHAGANGLI